MCPMPRANYVRRMTTIWWILATGALVAVSVGIFTLANRIAGWRGQLGEDIADVIRIFTIIVLVTAGPILIFLSLWSLEPPTAT